MLLAVFFSPGTFATATVGSVVTETNPAQLLARNDIDGVFNCAADGVLVLSEVIDLLGKQMAPIISPWGTGLSATLRDPHRHCRIVSLEALVAGFREGIGAGR